ncbi:hypothetical protein M086_3089 [Bacteroides fragilis str. S13 L11]|nr:hypothetical protein M086_3089 [Bacteroides fragilis str. S13 L11]EYE62286.1 hypothetical protein M149_4012 [Bacteroides fragilis str. 1007-1-F \
MGNAISRRMKRKTITHKEDFSINSMLVTANIHILFGYS